MRVTVGGGGSSGGSVVGKLFSSLFFLAFLGMGLFFCTLVVRAWWQGARSYGWERAECAIVSSEYQPNPEGSSSERFRTVVRYRYAWQGTEHEGSSDKSSSDAGEAQAYRDRYAADTRTPCFVNPRAPEESRLTRPSPFGILIILFPLLFVGAGGVPLYFLWRRPRPAAAEPAPRPLTEPPATPRAMGCVLVGFFGLFFAAGVAVLWWLMLAPLSKITRARSWEPTPCTVVSSTVASQSDSDGTTYRIEILYRYERGGRTYESSRYDFETAYSGDYAAKQAVVERYPPGQTCTCFVDPAQPSQAVLEREFRKSYWAGLFGLPFLLAGLFGLLWVSGAFSGRPKAKAAMAKTEPVRGGFSSWRDAAAPLRLRPKSGPWKKLAGSLFVNLFWNGIVTVFIVVIARGWRGGDHEWMPIIILTPFALIGVMLLAGLPYSFLALFNPRPWIELDRGAVAPGDAVGARYRLSGLAGRIGQLTIALEGREAVTTTMRSGNSTSTSSREALFHRSVLHDSGPGGATREGAFTLTVPADTMHSFSASNSAVRWKLKVHGDIPRWPDMDDEFEIEVAPREVGP